MEIRYKPSPIWSTQHWQVADGILTTPKGTQIDLSKVTSAHYINVYTKGKLVTEFKLTEPNESTAITCSDRPNGKQRELCFVLIKALLVELKHYNPSLQIRVGYGRFAKYAYSLVGLFMSGFGLSLFLEFARNSPEPILLFLGGMCVAIGAFMVWCVSPWQKPPHSSPSELETSLFSDSEPQISPET